MKWVQIGKTYRSGYYQVLPTIHGWEAWLYSKQKSGCLGREIVSFDKAKTLCETHAAQQQKPTDANTGAPV